MPTILGLVNHRVEHELGEPRHRRKKPWRTLDFWGSALSVVLLFASLVFIALVLFATT